MFHIKNFVSCSMVSVISFTALTYLTTQTSVAGQARNTLSPHPIPQLASVSESVSELMVAIPVSAASEEELPFHQQTLLTEIPLLPFYSQFADITQPHWQKVGCGIASLAMLIEHYQPNGLQSVDHLLQSGIDSGAYLSDAGWIHAGLISLSNSYELDGYTKSMSDLSMDEAFSKLKEELLIGPVMVSVHYTFDPKNPIPHLVVVSGVEGGQVHYSDPAEESGNNTISVKKFQTAWKKRYIAIRPA